LIAAPLTETGNQLIYTGDDTTDSAGPVSNLLPLPPYVYGQNDMKNADLDAESFKALAKSKSSAFLLFEDATSDIQSKYATVGLQDGGGSRYIARVVSLAKGTRLCKLTQYHMLRDTLSPWWSRVSPFEENDMGATRLFEAALLNGVSLREFIRFTSAVSLDWNLLDYYVEIQLNVDINGYWGQFAPQAGVQPPNKKIAGIEVHEKPSPGGDETTVHYDTSKDPESEVFVPDILGGFGSWQLYVPDFKKTYIDAGAVYAAKSTDTPELATHFGVPESRVKELLSQRDAWKKSAGKRSE
jgi:hypothetical protein